MKRSADRLEVLIGRMEKTMGRECDCSLAELRRENAKLAAENVELRKRVESV